MESAWNGSEYSFFEVPHTEPNVGITRIHTYGIP